MRESISESLLFAKRRCYVRLLMFFGAILVCPSLIATSEVSASSGAWTKVQTKHLILVGDASEFDMRDLAVRLEQFRAAMSRLVPNIGDGQSSATVLFVFRDEASYSAFKPLYRDRPAPDVAGYFQPGTTTDYITMRLDAGRGRSATEIAFHEYVHLLLKRKSPRTPLWFKEGIAEYYSTLDLSNTMRVTSGRPVGGRVLTLRGGELLSLETLFSVDYNSPHYTDPDKRPIFYAESWALVHYLLHGEEGARRAQLSRYLKLIANGAPTGEAFRQAFSTSFSIIENGLRAYVKRASYLKRQTAFDHELKFDPEVRSAPITNAEADAYLGDLLLYTDRLEEAENYLRRAADADAQLASAQMSLGVLCLRQNRFGEARQYLERAVALEEQNYLPHYYYADALSRDQTDFSIAGYIERTRLLRAELRRAIELAPRFLEAYRLLIEVELQRGNDLDEIAELIRRALAIAPEHQVFTLLRALLHIRREEFTTAREILGELLQAESDWRVRNEAEELLKTIAKMEEIVAQQRARHDNTISEFASKPQTLPCDLPQPGPHVKKLRFDGEQSCGRLMSIECDDAGVLLVVAAGSRTLRLRADALNQIRFVIYTAGFKTRIECGARDEPEPVLVTYNSRRGVETVRVQTDGDVIAVEFVPPEWNH